MKEQHAAVPRDGNVAAVRQTEQYASGARVDADDPPDEAADIRDAVDHRGGAGDRPPDPDSPQRLAAAGRDAVEDAVG